MNRIQLSATLMTLCLASACQGGTGAVPAVTAAAATPAPAAVIAPAPTVSAASPPAASPAPPVPATPDPAAAPAASPAGMAGAAHGPYVLAKGMTVDIAAATTLTFERIVSDSRCPKDVQCIWAGEVTIALRLKSPAGSDAFELSGRANARTVQGHSIELLSYAACPGGPAVTPLPGECAIVRVDQAAER